MTIASQSVGHNAIADSSEQSKGGKPPSRRTVLAERDDKIVAEPR